MIRLLCCASIVVALVIPVSAAQPALTVTVDPRIELLAAVQLLSGYGERTGLITQYDFPYKSDVAVYFEPYRNHPAVQRFSEMSEQGFSFDAPPTAMLYLTDPPALEPRLPFSETVIERAGSKEALAEFVAALRDFAKTSEFMSFFKAHAGSYGTEVADVQEKLAGVDYVGSLESYYGMRQHSYTIVLAPLFHPGGFGPRLVHEDGKAEIFSIVGPVSVDNGVPVFGTAENFRHTAWHEFSHSFVNPTTQRFAAQVADYESLFEPIREEMEKMSYGSWETCVNEHIVRAVTARLTAINLGEARGAEVLQNEKRRGFFYVEALSDRLKQYEQQRDSYPTFVDFYPQLLEVFRTLSEADLGPDFYSVAFAGTINQAIRGKVLFVVPTTEADANVQAAIRGYVEKIRDQFFEGAEIVTDREALERDLSDRSVLAYGTPEGNRWIARVLAEMPIEIGDAGIRAGAVYEGKNLRLISAWPNPQNSKNATVIYTAQRAEDVVGINAVFHGPTDFVVARGQDVLKSGDYEKESGVWSLGPP